VINLQSLMQQQYDEITSDEQAHNTIDLTLDSSQINHLYGGTTGATDGNFSKLYLGPSEVEPNSLIQTTMAMAAATETRTPNRVLYFNKGLNSSLERTQELI